MKIITYKNVIERVHVPREPNPDDAGAVWGEENDYDKDVTGLVLEKFYDQDVIVQNENNITVNGTYIISDLNINNTEIFTVNDEDIPEEFMPCKYYYNETDGFVENDEYVVIDMENIND